MPNIFKSLQKANDEAIAMQVALLQSVTMSNIMGSQIRNAGRTAVGVINWLGQTLFDRNNIVDEPEAREVKELIQENYQKLQGTSRQELGRLLRSELTKRVDRSRVKSDETLSEAVIDEAVKNFDDVGEHLTFSQKADVIANRFHNRIRDNLNKMLSEQNAAQARQMEQTLDADISKMSQRERKAMQEVLPFDMPKLKKLKTLGELKVSAPKLKFVDEMNVGQCKKFLK